MVCVWMDGWVTGAHGGCLLLVGHLGVQSTILRTDIMIKLKS